MQREKDQEEDMTIGCQPQAYWPINTEKQCERNEQEAQEQKTGNGERCRFQRRVVLLHHLLLS